MGQSESTPSSATDFSNCETLGYRVLGVQPSSPASEAGLVSFFDFLVGCNGDMLIGTTDEDDDLDFIGVLKDNIGTPLELLVFNIKSQSTRIVQITPSSTWGGHGLLGVTIRLDDYSSAEDHLLRILSVTTPHSPAHKAGLTPLVDYLLGTRTASFSSSEVLSQTLTSSEGSVVEVYVYNTETDLVRVVNLTPWSDWEGGNGGLLGAEVGMGYLHRLPAKCRGSDGKSEEMEVKQMVVGLSSQEGMQEAAGDAVVDFTAEVVKETTAHKKAGQDARPKDKELNVTEQVTVEHQPPDEQEKSIEIANDTPAVTTPPPKPPSPPTVTVTTTTTIPDNDKTPPPSEVTPSPEIPAPPPPITPSSTQTQSIPPPPPATIPTPSSTTTTTTPIVTNATHPPPPPLMTTPRSQPLPPPPMSHNNTTTAAAAPASFSSGYKSFLSPFLPPAPFMSSREPRAASTVTTAEK